MNPSLIPKFLDRLQGVASSSTMQNPYLSADCVQNLSAYLDTLCSLPYSGHLLVGEAQGYLGCALTGIPLTSQRLLSESSHPFLQQLKPMLSIAGVSAESTATIVWNHLDECKAVPALWNIFPFHPHQKDDPRSNRKPSAEEIHVGKDFLELILDILAPHSVIAVGGTSAEAIERLFPESDAVAVRHPSHGGKSDFIAGVKAAGII